VYFKTFIVSTIFMPMIGGGFSHAYLIVHQYFDLQIKTIKYLNEFLWITKHVFWK